MTTYAALTRRRLVWGCPSVETKRICLGGGTLLPPFFWGEGWLIASKLSSGVTTHWAPACKGLGLRANDRSQG